MTLVRMIGCRRRAVSYANVLHSTRAYSQLIKTGARLAAGNHATHILFLSAVQPWRQLAIEPLFTRQLEEHDRSLSCYCGAAR
jgi:hypothetical protein